MLPPSVSIYCFWPERTLLPGILLFVSCSMSVPIPVWNVSDSILRLLTGCWCRCKYLVAETMAIQLGHSPYLPGGFGSSDFAVNHYVLFMSPTSTGSGRICMALD